MMEYAIVSRIRRKMKAGKFVESIKIYCDLTDPEEIRAVDAAFPTLRNYDENGNYVGPVRQEDGGYY